jgi:methyl-accepting chemotaxis protein
MTQFITKLKVKQKLQMLFIAMLTLLAVSSLVAMGTSLLIRSNIMSMYDHDVQARIMANRMERYYNEVQKNIYFAILTTDADQTDQYLTTAEEARSNLEDSLDTLRGVYTGSLDLDKIESQMTLLKGIHAQIETFARANEMDQALALSESDCQPNSEILLSELDEVIADTSSRGNASFSQTMTIMMAVIGVILAFVAISAVVGILINKRISRNISLPLHQVKAAVEELAKGNFDLTLTYESVDELGEMVTSLRSVVDAQKRILGDVTRGISMAAHKDLTYEPAVEMPGDFIPLKEGMQLMTDSLSEILGSMQESANYVSEGSSQLSSTSQDLANGSGDQAASIEELQATINEIEEQVRQNGLNSEEGNKRAQNADQEAENSAQHMHEMIQAMDRISDTSKQIEMIIKSIEDIASQTNLLSLNAAIEAARAGETGKGFQVVAGEIRELANQSAQAAADTKKLISNAMAEIDRGNKTAQATAMALKKVKTEISVIKNAAEAVQSASASQTKAIHEVVTEMEQISSVITGNASLAQEASAISDELASQAETLSNLAKQFEIKHQKGYTGPKGGRR